MKFPQEKFVRGQVVRLKSGGPPMTVETPATSQESVRCTWFAGAKKQSSYFNPDTLEEIPDGNPK